MELKKLAPWNWFKSEEEKKGHIPVVKHSSSTNHDPFSIMRNEINRMFDDFNTSFGNFPLASSFGNFMPTVDIQDKDDEYQIAVEVPGVDKDDVKIEINDGLMLISGEKKHEHKEKKDSFYRIESSYGRFERTLNLPIDADEEKVNANFINGVLKIEIAKNNQKRAIGREITIN
ncbi:MAG: Hsp20/alpha crystallin family protein [Bdellovibrionota bacterium]|nr:Hsp20/alpha crystallin family protein [Bdellovibrionota bacterium]